MIPKYLIQTEIVFVNNIKKAQMMQIKHQKYLNIIPNSSVYTYIKKNSL